jgi:hypothetical protein
LCQLIAPTRGRIRRGISRSKLMASTFSSMEQMLMDENSDKAQRVMKSMLQMGKIDIAALKRAQAA